MAKKQNIPMTEKDIRPADLQKECERLSRLDAGELLKFSDAFEEVSCPACGTENEALCFEKAGYHFKKCTRCRTVYISPRPPPEQLKTFYATSKGAKFWQEKMFAQTRQARIENIFKPRVDMVLAHVEKHGIAKDTIVDVGAGSGFFGQEMAARKVFGKIILVEPGPLEFDHAGPIEVIHDIVENVELDSAPGVITSFELIEHLFSPREFVAKIYELLGDNSLFMFTTPNFEGFEMQTLYTASPNIVGPSHLNYFNTDSIQILLKSAGFKDILVSTPGKLDTDIVKNAHLEGRIDLSSQPFLHHLLIEQPARYAEAFQQFLQVAGLSSHMMVMAHT